MRSLQRKPWPKDQQGCTKSPSPSNYKAFLVDLEDNFGQYCCYCERRELVDVEHVVPQSSAPLLVCNWHNLLLACPKCNRDYKKDKNSGRAGYIWPDTSDSFDLYEYHADGSVSEKKSVHPRTQAEVKKTIELFHLNGKLRNLRCEQWDIASDDLKDYKNGTRTVERIVKNVVANGYWSVWMTVFKDYPEVTQKIADAFSGTLPKYCTPPANP